MQSSAPPSRSVPDWTAPGSTSVGPSADSEITWLLHRAAQRMRSATGEQAEKHGIQLRDYIVLSALDKTPNLTQVELGKALGLDRTTLMTQLDRLERTGLVVRRSDPRDRRARIPEITEAGNTLRATVASACDSVEAAAMDSFSQDQVQIFRRMLFAIIGDSEDRGSCL
jgi:MarR family transcriptional regulator, organic hydroperoxide resistance regulator